MSPVNSLTTLLIKNLQEQYKKLKIQTNYKRLHYFITLPSAVIGWAAHVVPQHELVLIIVCIGKLLDNKLSFMWFMTATKGSPLYNCWDANEVHN